MSFPKNRRWLDAAALLIVLLYGGMIWSAQPRAGGVALDATWQRIQERGVLRVATDVGFRPFADLHNGAYIGYDVALTQHIGARLGVEVMFVPTGYDALYDALTSERADLVASALPYAPEQGYRARFSSIYFDNGFVLLVREESPLVAHAPLSSLRVGAVLGSEADTQLRRMGASDSTIMIDVQYDTADQVIAALRDGTLDAVIVEHVEALTAINRQSGLRIVQALTSDPYVLAMPNDAFQLQAEVNRVLDELRREDALTQLGATWFK